MVPHPKIFPHKGRRTRFMEEGGWCLLLAVKNRYFVEAEEVRIYKQMSARSLVLTSAQF
jgi:hypothetical protein